ncbi:hypothetical protein [Candidatus Nanohalococcus occultus]|uniref:hypothetical protein n=1 Tax=Candidatus Nanohalococcus occultus TaxID=2978047 RepID=UPI0039DFEF72
MSFPRVFKEPSPSYRPKEFDFSQNTNIVYVSEIHAFEPIRRKDQYLQHVGDQMNAYAELFEAQRVSILGDTGSISDVEDVLEPLDDKTDVWIVAGDEDKVSRDDSETDRAGWFWQASSAQPFDVGNDYRIFDEGYETEINGRRVQAAHHPTAAKRDDSIQHPDPRFEEEKEIDQEPESPEELFALKNKEGFLDRLFSVERDSNENTMKRPDKSMENADVVLYDHVHMPYPRKIGQKAVNGLGGRSHNYQIKADCMPSRSIHVLSYGEDFVHAMHFDADSDEIFEHQIFDFSDSLEMYDVMTPLGTNNSSTYKPLQTRFRGDQISKKAHEKESPPLWSNRDQS